MKYTVYCYNLRKEMYTRELFKQKWCVMNTNA